MSHPITGPGPRHGNWTATEPVMTKVFNFADIKRLKYLLLSYLIGYEYCADPGMAAWQSYEKTIHTVRRRRWVRTRKRVLDAAAIAKQQVQPG